MQLAVSLDDSCGGCHTLCPPIHMCVLPTQERESVPFEQQLEGLQRVVAAGKVRVGAV